MLKKLVAGLMLFASLSFGMSLSKLNSATKAELMEINGVGEVKAAEIVKQRRKGKFKSFADLQERVDGIGEQTAANIKGDVKNAADVKKVVKKKMTKKRKTAKTKMDEKKKGAKAKTKRKTKPKAEDAKKETTKKKRRIKKMTDKKEELKKKTRKTRAKKPKTKKLKVKKLKKKK